MPAPGIDELRDEKRFRLLAGLGHTDLIPFVGEYYRRNLTWVTALHYAFSVALLAIAVATGITGGYSLDTWLSRFGAAVLSFLVLLPIHEAIHGIVYRLAGARDVRYGVSLRQFYAYAIAHHFVANRRVFTWVAIMPFLAINTALILAAVLVEPYRFYLVSVLLLHSAGCSGDFAFLSYLWIHRREEFYTYDDADEKVSYLFARVVN